MGADILPASFRVYRRLPPRLHPLGPEARSLALRVAKRCWAHGRKRGARTLWYQKNDPGEVQITRVCALRTSSALLAS